MDLRFRVIVAINLDIDTYFEMGDYRAFRIKSVKIGDLKTLEVIELSLADYPDVLKEFEITKDSIIIIKDYSYILFNFDGDDKSSAIGKDVSNYISIEINGKHIKKTAYHIGSLENSDGLIVASFTYKSKSSIITIQSWAKCTDASTFKITNAYSDDVKITVDVIKQYNNYYSVEDYFGYSGSTYELFDRLLVDLEKFDATFICPTDYSKLELFGSWGMELDNFILNDRVKDITIHGNIKIKNLIVSSGVDLNIIKRLVWLRILNKISTYGFLAETGFSIRNRIRTCSSIKSLRRIRVGQLTIGELMDIREIK